MATVGDQDDLPTPGRTHTGEHGRSQLSSVLLLEGDVPHIERDLGSVLCGPRVQAELLELFYLTVSRVHIASICLPGREDRVDLLKLLIWIPLLSFILLVFLLFLNMIAIIFLTGRLVLYVIVSIDTIDGSILLRWRHHLSRGRSGSLWSRSRS